MTNTDYLYKYISTANDRWRDTTDDEWLGDPYSSGFTFARGSSKSYRDMEYVLREIWKPFAENENKTTYVPVRSCKNVKLPDSYPKDDLDRLLGFESDGD